MTQGDNRPTWRASEFQLVQLAHWLLQQSDLPFLRKRMRSTPGTGRRDALRSLCLAVLRHDRVLTRLSIDIYQE